MDADTASAVAAWYAALVSTAVALDVWIRRWRTRRASAEAALSLNTIRLRGGALENPEYLVEILFEPPGSHTRYRYIARGDGHALFYSAKRKTVTAVNEPEWVRDPASRGAAGISSPLGDARRGPTIVNWFVIEPDHPWRSPRVTVEIHDEASGRRLVRKRFHITA